MRNYQPVTGREYPFPQGQIVISCTDIKRRITRANNFDPVPDSVSLSKLKKWLFEVTATAESINTENLTRPLPPDSNDEIGDLNASLSVMRINLHELIPSVREMRSVAASGMAVAMEDSSLGH